MPPPPYGAGIAAFTPLLLLGDPAGAPVARRAGAAGGAAHGDADDEFLSRLGLAEAQDAGLQGRTEGLAHGDSKGGGGGGGGKDAARVAFLSPHDSTGATREEVRQDTDGEWYTRAEFVEYYGSAAEWEEASAVT